MHRFENISDDEWYELLLRSVDNPVIDGVEFPAFPSHSVQTQFVGSSNEDALREGFEFYKVVKGYAHALGKPIERPSTTLLDFGCGWGRFLRFFSRDVDEQRLHGVDIDPDVLNLCRANRVPAKLRLIEPQGTLPYPDQTFDCVIAYSVFTHLPEPIHMHWVREIARVAKPGCVLVLTLESSRFLDFVAGLRGSEKLESGWHEGLKAYSARSEELKSAYVRGEFVYLPTGGGDHRPPERYGDAAVPIGYVERHWSEWFVVREFIDNRFWQAVLVVQRR